MPKTRASIGNNFTPAEAAPQARLKGAVTLKDIARIAGVSAQTVSCVVNGTGSVSEEMRLRVRRIADRMGYLPNKSAKAMRTGRSQTLGLVISDMGNPFFPELARAVERAAALAGYAVLLVDAHGSLDKVADRIAALPSHPVDGIIATEYSPIIGRLGLPTVLIGGPVKGLDCVNADDTSGGLMLAEHVLAQGHRDFGLITGSRGACLPLRRAAFLSAIAGKGRVLWEHWTADDESMTPEIAAALHDPKVGCLICSNDFIATGVLRMLREIGRTVPEDVSITGFDDIPWAAIVTPPLTTVRQPYEAMGSKAVAMLHKRIGDRTRRSRHLKIAVRFIERESVAKHRAPELRPREAPTREPIPAAAE